MAEGVEASGADVLYSKEFYILWKTGIAESDDVPMDTVAISNIAIDDGDTTLIRVFHSNADDHQRAEDKLLDWLTVDGYITECSKMDMELYFNHSPLGAFSKAFADLKQAFLEQEKEVRCEIKIVRVSNTDGQDEDAYENREGLRDLNAVGIELSPVTGKDWQYLRQILRERRGLREQERRCRMTRQNIQRILKNPADAQTHAVIDVQEKECQTDGKPEAEEESEPNIASSSSDED